MEKLIELLNEHDKEKGLHIFWKITLDKRIQIYGKGICSESYLISKKYGFIKWLVENEKIDFGNLDYMINIKAPKRELYYTKAGFHTEALLMLLSIQDEPIEFLISILK